MAQEHKRKIMRAMFDELAAKKERILRQVAPYRETYDRLSNATELIEARRMIKECNKKLGEIENEMVGLARGLGARVMVAEKGSLIIHGG